MYNSSLKKIKGGNLSFNIKVDSIYETNLLNEKIKKINSKNLNIGNLKPEEIKTFFIKGDKNV